MSQKAISGSIIQNSAAWVLVLLFSARKVGPKVYTLEKAMAKVSASSWPVTARAVGLPKKSSSGFLPSLGSRVVTVKVLPAPSASLEVIRGV